MSARDHCEVCGVHLMPEPPPRCEDHVHTEPGDPEWEELVPEVDPVVVERERVLAELETWWKNHGQAGCCSVGDFLLYARTKQVQP